jgi:hypothetical protein
MEQTSEINKKCATTKFYKDEKVLRVPHPLRFSKGADLDSRTNETVNWDDPKIPTLAKTARMGHPEPRIEA